MVWIVEARCSHDHWATSRRLSGVSSDLHPISLGRRAPLVTGSRSWRPRSRQSARCSKTARLRSQSSRARFPLFPLFNPPRHPQTPLDRLASPPVIVSPTGKCKWSFHQLWPFSLVTRVRDASDFQGLFWFVRVSCSNQVEGDCLLRCFFTVLGS